MLLLLLPEQMQGQHIICGHFGEEHRPEVIIFCVTLPARAVVLSMEINRIKSEDRGVLTHEVHCTYECDHSLGMFWSMHLLSSCREMRPGGTVSMLGQLELGLCDVLRHYNIKSVDFTGLNECTLDMNWLGDVSAVQLLMRLDDDRKDIVRHATLYRESTS